MGLGSTGAESGFMEMRFVVLRTSGGSLTEKAKMTVLHSFKLCTSLLGALLHHPV